MFFSLESLIILLKSSPDLSESTRLNKLFCENSEAIPAIKHIKISNLISDFKDLFIVK